MQYTTRELVDYYNTENHLYQKKKVSLCKEPFNKVNENDLQK